MLGTFVVLYLFLGGAGAATLGVASAWSLAFFRAPGRPAAQTEAFRGMRRILLGGAFVVLAASALCLLMDLGRPERALLLFVRPTFSYLSVGSFALAGCLLVAGGLLAGSVVAPRRRAPSRLERAAEALAVALAAAVMLYTGLYLAWLQAVPLWSNAALPWLLALSSLSTGLALALAAAPFCRDWRLLEASLAALRCAHRWVLVLTAAAFAVFLALAWENPFAAPGLAALTSPAGMGLWLFAGFLGAGVAVPLAIEWFAERLPAPSPLIGAELLCAAGGLILRFCLAAAGTH